MLLVPIHPFIGVKLFLSIISSNFSKFKHNKYLLKFL
nr:MAG TPA: hypothetical protein [Caudoviricetes sp.]